MSRRFWSVAGTLALLGGMTGAAWAQEKADDRQTSPAGAAEATTATQGLTPLKIQIAISREQDGKQVSRVPYVLSVVSDQQFSQVRMSTRVPVATGDARGGPQGPIGFVQENVGTSIDCGARSLHDGRFRLTVSIEDSSVYVGKRTTDSGDALAARPSLRVFKSTQHVILSDGESTQYTMATDKITGEVIKVEVSLQVAGK